MNTKIIQEQDSQKLFANGARLAIEHVNGMPGGEVITIALCGGRSIVSLLHELFKQMKVLTVQQRARLHFFMVDERLVPLSDDNSNFKLLKNEFFDSMLEEGLIAPEQIHPFVVDEKKTDFGVADYAEQLRKHSGKFNLVFLGVGEDSHVAALFPNHSSIQSESDFFISFTDSPKPPSNRMSASKSLIKRASFAVAIVVGAAKAEALSMYRDDALSVEQCPLKLLDEIEASHILTDLA